VSEQPHDLMQELDLLDPATVRLYLNDYSELFLRVGTEESGPVTARLSFPLSYPQEFVTLSLDGEEIGLIRKMRELDKQSRQVLGEELAWRHFVTRITAIHSIDVRHYVPHWDVETERGRHVFEMRSRRDLRVMDRRILVRDADGNRFEIAAIDGLDPASRQLIEGQI